MKLLARRNREPVLPAALLSCRYHGSLDVITDSERRALRPIGSSSAHEVADRTESLLDALGPLPSVRIFRGIRPADADLPRIPHAISAGRRVLLVESVAWPPGRYIASATGQIYCDGAYIGQSVRPLLAAVRYWREALPPRHQVRALVVVHPVVAGELALPPAAGPELNWVRADEAVSGIQGCLSRRRQAVSGKAVAILAAATGGSQLRGHQQV